MGMACGEKVMRRNIIALFCIALPAELFASWVEWTQMSFMMHRIYHSSFRVFITFRLFLWLIIIIFGVVVWCYLERIFFRKNDDALEKNHPDGTGRS